MIVAGIDPGFAFLGAAFVELLPTRTRVVHHETFATSTKDTDEDRLDSISEHVLDLFEQFEPVAIGYENQAWADAAARARKLKSNEEEVAVSSASRRVHEVSGIIRCAARCYDLPCYCLAPSTIKVGLLGKGGMKQKGKEPVKARVRQIFGVVCSEHAADAIATAISTAVRHRRHLATMATHMQLIH